MSFLDGTNQQDFEQIQLVSGAFPYQVGLQQRFPGKNLLAVFDGPIGNIFPFYNVYGRPYNLVDTNGRFIITPVPLNSITIPALATTGNRWFDSFGTYSPTGLIQLLWGEGAWPGDGIGVCQSIIEGFIDPFLIYAAIDVHSIPDFLPSVVPGSSIPATPDSTSPAFAFPFTPCNVYLRVTTATADNSCTGQGTETFSVADEITAFSAEGDPIIDQPVLHAYDITVKHSVLWHGIRVGRLPDITIPGYVQGTCPGPAQPVPIEYYLNIWDGSYGIQS